jgi:hypothetical protein
MIKIKITEVEEQGKLIDNLDNFVNYLQNLFSIMKFSNNKIKELGLYSYIIM